MVPSRDYFACAEEDIANITSDLTVVGGKLVYGAGRFAECDENPPPPAMPAWSPVRAFGGYGAWRDRHENAGPSMRVCPGHAHVLPRTSGDARLWGDLGCGCWAF
jgi:hypothetical protein